MWFYVGLKQAGSNPYLALISAGIGFLASVVVFWLKEARDARRAKESAVNILKMMSISLKGSLGIAPAEISVLSMDKSIGLLQSLATDIKLVNCFIKYEECWRSYLATWKKSGVMSDGDQKRLEAKLDEVIAGLSQR